MAMSDGVSSDLVLEIGESCVGTAGKWVELKKHRCHFLLSMDPKDQDGSKGLGRGVMGGGALIKTSLDNSERSFLITGVVCLGLLVAVVR
jgi:hypothetical protein